MFRQRGPGPESARQQPPMNLAFYPCGHQSKAELAGLTRQIQG
jgi:hypothetical protein